MSSRDRLAVILVICVCWAFIAGLIGVFYRTGAEAVADPRKYAYIHWYDWLAAALLPLLVASVLGAWWFAFGRHEAAE